MVPLATAVYPWEAKDSLKSALCAVYIEVSIVNRLAAREWGTFWASYPVTKVQTETGARVPTNSAALTPIVNARLGSPGQCYASQPYGILH
jgi:hypothetical protein